MLNKTFKVRGDDHTYTLSSKRPGWFKPTEIYADDIKIGDLTSRELRKGKEFTLPDQTKIQMKLERTFMTYNFQIMKDGKPIEGSPGSPREKIKSAYAVLGFLGGLNLLIGLLVSVFSIQAMLKLGYGEYNILMGLIYGFAFAIGRKERAFLPLAAGFALFLLDTVLAIMMMAKYGTTSGIVVRVILGTPIFVGLKEAWKGRK